MNVKRDLKNTPLNFLLHPMSMWLILAASLLVTFSAWKLADTAIRAKAEERFDFQANDLAFAVKNRLHEYETLLRGGAGLFTQAGVVSRADWKKYVDSLQIQKELPGIQGMGFTLMLPADQVPRHIAEIRREGFHDYEIRPPGIRSTTSSIIYLEPFEGRNLRAFGYDMFSEPVRRAAMTQAMETGEPAISGRVTLVQEDQNVQYGFLIYVPVYKKGLPADTPEQRRAAILGFVYAPFRAGDFVRGIAGDEKAQIHYELFSGPEPSDQTFIFLSSMDQQVHALRALPPGEFSALRQFSILNATWSIFVHAPKTYASTPVESILPTTLAVTGIAIDLLLFAIIAWFRRNRLGLQAAEKRLSLALEGRHQGVYDWDIAGGIFHISAMWRDLIGMDEVRDTCPMEAWTALIYPDDRDPVKQALHAHFKKQTPSYESEYRVCCADGQYRWLHDCGNVVEWFPDGKAKRMVGTVTDVTELHQTTLRMKQYVNLVNSSNVPFLLIDTDLRFVVSNPAFASLFGMQDSKMVGESVEKIIGPKIFATVEPFLLACRTGWPQHHQFSGLLPNGQFVNFDANLYPHRVDGNVQGIVAVLNEITELLSIRQSLEIHQQHLEHLVAARTAELLATEQRMRLILESSADGLIGTDVTGAITFVNPAAGKILGYIQDELLGQNVHAAIHYQHADGRTYPVETCEVILAIREGRSLRSDSDIFWGKEGQAIPVTVASHPINDDGKIVGAVLSFADISERQRAAAALQESEARFREVANAAPALIWMAGLDMLCFWFNQGWLDFTGRQMAQEIGNGWAERVHPDDIQRCLDTYTEFFGARLPFSMEYRLLRHDGVYRWILDNGAPRFDGTGEFSGYIGTCIDIDDIKQAEAAREAARIAAEELARIKSEFLANMSHEIRTPLNGVLGLAQIGYRDSTGRDKSKETFSRILDSGKLLLSIINDILDFSKIESGKVVLETIPFSPRLTVEDAMSVVADRAAANGLSLSLQLDPNLPRACVGDPTRVSQILLNFLSNAIKFTHMGSVTLQARLDAKQLIFAVTDSGIGMTPAQIKGLFNPFEQADASITRQYGGTGLGLSISHRLAGLMGGEIRVQSSPDEGSRFELRLPYVIAEAELERIPESATIPAGGKGQRLAGLSILAAEDNELNQFILRDMLECEGATVVMADNGIAALEAVRQNPSGFDLVLMDVQMPEMDGREATLRIHAIAAELPVLGQTAHALIDEREKCLVAGMVDTITKPLYLDALVALVQRHARGGTHPVDSSQALRSSTSPVSASLINTDELMRRHSNRPGFLQKLVNIALQTQQQKTNQLRLSATEKNFDSLRFLAHSIKGLAGNFDSSELMERALALELSAQDESHNSISLAEELAQCLEHFFTELEVLGKC